ncbi:MAG: hybrid sensor histidine kinase/response regulator [Elusimicrobia bacterium]|nr:hybrid sensor histidine kinase/response regulator [Elusimicrobiota bacterium]
MQKTIQTLLIEDNPGDAELVRQSLALSGNIFEIQHLLRLSTALDRLAAGPADIVLLDPGLPDSQGLDSFVRIHAQSPKSPIVILSGRDDEALAVEAISHGAQDYVVKGSYDERGLAQILRYSILRKHAENVECTSARRESFTPAASHDLRNPGVASGDSRNPSESIRVLLLEDDPRTVDIVRLCLDETDSMGLRFELESAGTLADGLRLLAGERFDALLLDLLLPDSRGIETMLRIIKEGHDIPILIVTNPGSEPVALEALRLGAQDYMVKSTSDSRLLKRSIRYAIERHKLQRELASLKEPDLLKDNLIGVVSHELRSPLSVVHAAIINLIDGLAGRLTPEQNKIALIGRRNTERMAHLVENLLNLSRLKSGRARTDLRGTALGPLLQNAAARLEEAVRDKRLSLKIESPEELPQVQADPELLDEVIDNLLNNAVRFAKSRVTLRAIPSAEGPGGAAVIVEVLNDGEPIPTERMSELFNAFVQLARPHGSGHKGSGLGLAICKTILALHGTGLDVKSSLEDGTCFRFALRCESNVPVIVP